MKSKNLNETFRNLDLSIILPCYNEEKNIKILCLEFKKLINKYNIKTELILVNNGSNDGTKKELLKEKKNNRHIKTFNLKKNQGYGGGILYGLFKSQGVFVSWSHADCQCKLEDIFRIYNNIKKNKNFFGKGYRVNKRHYIDELLSKTHSMISSIILGIKLKDINAQPKIFHYSFLKYLENAPKYFTTLDTFAYYIAEVKNYKIFHNKVNFSERYSGKSKWKASPLKIIYTLFMNIIFLINLRFRFKIK